MASVATRIAIPVFRGAIASLATALASAIGTRFPMSAVALVFACTWLFASIGSALLEWIRAEWTAVLAATENNDTKSAWLLTALLGVFLLAGGSFVVLKTLALQTNFGRSTVLALAPACIAVVMIASVLSSIPFARLLERFYMRRRQRGRPIRFGWTISFVAVVSLLVISLAFLESKKSIGYLDVSWLLPPCCGVATLVVLPRTLGPIRMAVLLGVAMCVVAIVIRIVDPSQYLEIWSREGFASRCVENVFSLEKLRGTLSPQAVQLARNTSSPDRLARDIVLITIDTMRFDRTPLGGGPAVMPALASVAASGTSFSWAFAPSNVTRRSIPSLITGLDASRIHGAVAGWALRMDPRHLTLAERLRQSGYDTYGFFCCESFWGPQHELGINRGIDHLVIHKDGNVLASAAASLLRERSQRPRFVWLHFIEPHNWAEHGAPPDAPDRKKKYDLALAEVDRMLGLVVDAVSPDAYLVITSDHGESLGDKGQPFHATDLSNHQLRVPLVWRGPDIRVNETASVASVTDIAPTLIALNGFLRPLPASMDGQDLSRFLRGTSPVAPSFASFSMIRDRSIPDSASGIAVGEWKFILSEGKRELYRLSDHHELRNVAKENPHQTAIMEEWLRKLHDFASVSPFESLR